MAFTPDRQEPLRIGAAVGIAAAEISFKEGQKGRKVRHVEMV